VVDIDLIVWIPGVHGQAMLAGLGHNKFSLCSKEGIIFIFGTPEDTESEFLGRQNHQRKS
jgi:hypothetical protein